MLTRRSILTGAGALLIASPAIVRAASIMPVKTVLWEPYSRTHYYDGYADGRWIRGLHDRTTDRVVGSMGWGLRSGESPRDFDVDIYQFGRLRDEHGFDKEKRLYRPGDEPVKLNSSVIIEVF